MMSIVEQKVWKFLCLIFVMEAKALELEVNVHYPEKGSPMQHCGFRLQVATMLSDPVVLIPMSRRGPDLFTAISTLPDSFLYTDTSVGVMADFSHELMSTPECMAVCSKLAPQGQVIQTGPFSKVEALGLYNKVDLWPSFCLMDGEWTTVNASFSSAAIGRHVHLRTRVPATVVENPLPRPGRLLPPLMIRFNAEWYWPQAVDPYQGWHSLMVNGAMQPLAVAELYVDGVEWNSWFNQPILTTQPLMRSCSACDPELHFVCKSWEKDGYGLYQSGNHSFGTGKAFFDELYDVALPQLLQQLPKSSDDALPQLGVWGYCIGGLAAWNALTSRPGRFQFAYLGSPAMDFNCGAPFHALDNITWGSSLPKVYIDNGAAEDALMGRQSKLLFHRLLAKGFMEGRDVFYEQAPFGTHQSRGLMRRALRALLVLFGEGAAGQAAGQATYVPVAHQVFSTLAAFGSKSAEKEDLEQRRGSGSAEFRLQIAFTAFAILAAFVAGRLTAAAGVSARGLRASMPLLA
mmetsp:Transcript_2504/g.7038  ORF Transcript_2504/g.7038 Transcript_2504/m.7038 type:complete len:517 (-) Transcript_2504:65-1615(-)